MRVEQIEVSLLNRPCEERRQFATWFYEHEKEILELQGTEDSEADLSAEQKAELLRRWERCEAHLERLEPWAGTTDRLHARRWRGRKGFTVGMWSGIGHRVHDVWVALSRV